VLNRNPFDDHGQSGVQGTWMNWLYEVLSMFAQLYASLELLGMAPILATDSREAADAADSAAAAADEADEGSGTASTACGQPDSSSSSGVCGSSSSASAQAEADSSSNEHVKWRYLLHLQECSPQWTAAAADFAARWHAFDWGCLDDLQLFTTAVAAEDAPQLYADALQLYRTLTDVAPLTVLCNNPSCQNLAGVREAALACKACSGCGCRYCSVVCQQALTGSGTSLRASEWQLLAGHVLRVGTRCEG
jgi:hypothetical protein